MERLLYVQEGRKNEIVAEAIDQQVPCTLSCRGVQGWSSFKTRFVSGAPVGRLMIEPPARDGEPGGLPLVSGERVGVSFRRGHKKCMFATIVLTAGPLPLLANQPERSVLELQWPEALQELQRRMYYRASPPGRIVRIRFWAGGVAARAQAEADAALIYTGAMVDLSAGGVRLTTVDVSTERFQVGDAVGCAFTPKPRGDTLVLECVFRHAVVLPDGRVDIGLQFVGLEATEEGRLCLASLARIVTDFQRAEARNQRARYAGQMSTR